MMEHKGYRAKVTFDDEVELFHGEVIDTLDVITFQGVSVEELRDAFRGSVDEYLKVCAEMGRSPDKPFSGRIPLRVAPNVHRAATAAAKAEGKSLNAWISETVERTANRTI
jgi:predicted HicB family RNase H-like nuclease